MNKLYIIGNGFDRFHDLPTGYYNYAQWLEETGSEVLDEIYETFGDCDSNWWSGFEQNLASINTIEYASNIAQEHVPDFASDEFRDRDWYEAEYAVEEKLSEILGMSIEKIRNVLMCCEDTVSLYDSLGRGPEEAEYTLLCAIKNESSPLPDEIYERKQINLMIEELFSVLTDIQRKVIEQYFGFYNQKPKSIQNIADELGCSRENIDQIKSTALKRMRKHLADKKDNDLNTFSKFSLNTNYFWYNFIGFKKSEVLEAINELVNEENLSFENTSPKLEAPQEVIDNFTHEIVSSSYQENENSHDIILESPDEKISPSLYEKEETKLDIQPEPISVPITNTQKTLNDLRKEWEDMKKSSFEETPSEKKEPDKAPSFEEAKEEVLSYPFGGWTDESNYNK